MLKTELMSTQFWDQFDWFWNKILVKHSFNNPYTGGLGSYSLFLMLYTATKIEEMNKFDSFRSEDTLSARLFTWFLNMFGECFDYETMAIMFVQGYIPMTFPKIYWGIDPTQNPKVLWVFDPYKANNNTTQKAFKFDEIRKLFAEIKQIMLKEYQQIYKLSEYAETMTILDKII